MWVRLTTAASGAPTEHDYGPPQAPHSTPSPNLITWGETVLQNEDFRPPQPNPSPLIFVDLEYIENSTQFYEIQI